PGYFQSVEERHQRDARLAHLLLEDQNVKSQILNLEETDPVVFKFAQAQLNEEIIPRTVQGELTHADISPAFHVLLNSRGILRFATAIDNPSLAKAISTQTWPYAAVLGDEPLARRYLWMDGALYLAMGVPINAVRGEEPTHVYFVGYRVDDHWLNK